MGSQPPANRVSPQPDEAPGAHSAQPIAVLINLRLESRLVDSIIAVDPRVRALQVYAPGAPTSQPPGHGLAASADEWQREEGDALAQLQEEAEVLFSVWVPIDWLDRMPNLKWLQLASAGADHVIRDGIFDRRPDLIVTTASGIHATPITEHITGVILFFTRRLGQAVSNQSKHKWQHYEGGEARGKTLCLVGYGPIARRMADVAAALGMRTVAVRASIEREEKGSGSVARFYPAAGLNAALAGADFVVVAAPRTPQTERMIGKEQFATLKPGAVLINISRGALVDEAAMIEALREGRLAGAGLDVFENEPLPPESPLWSMPNVLITPHNAGSSPYYDERATELFRDNLARYIHRQPLRNVVDPQRGY